uniref:Uncharacterized protein n=1 Tax=Chrysotila carterae TaxID=13221 RepID=A0A7S4BYT6_CHRCT
MPSEARFAFNAPDCSASRELRRTASLSRGTRSLLRPWGLIGAYLGLAHVSNCSACVELLRPVLSGVPGDLVEAMAIPHRRGLDGMLMAVMRKACCLQWCR